MDTNGLNYKFIVKDIDIEVIRKLIGLSEGDDSITVMTNIGVVKVPKNNKIDLGIEWINELQLLKNNTLKATLSYPKYFNNNNGFEITKQEQIQEVQEQFVEILEKAFSAKVDVKNSKHTRIDFPINISDITDFRDWMNVLTLIARATSDKDNTLYYGVDSKSKRIYTKGILVPVQADIDINFYNQREKLKRKTNEDIGKEVLRVETRLKKEYVIKKYLGASEVKKVKLKAIRQVSRDLLKTSILDKLAKELQEQKDYISRELQEYLRATDKTNKDRIAHFIALYQTRIFDYEIVSLAIKDLEVHRLVKSSYRKQAREALQQIESISGYETKYFNNFSRINYLHYKLLGRKYQSYDIKSYIK